MQVGNLAFSSFFPKNVIALTAIITGKREITLLIGGQALGINFLLGPQLDVNYPTLVYEPAPFLAILRAYFHFAHLQPRSLIASFYGASYDQQLGLTRGYNKHLHGISELII